MKVLIFDSGTLINLSMNGLLEVLEKLKTSFNGKYIITRAVKREIVDRPSKIDKYELGALRIQDLLDRKIIEMPDSIGLDDLVIEKRTAELLDMANHFMQVKDNWIDIVSEAEVSCLAVSEELNRRDVENIIAIDERTLRLLCEGPENLERIMSAKIHQRVQMVSTNYNIFSNFRFIRSSEIVYVAYKKGAFDLTGKNVLEALLYATKYKGAAISFEEINALKKG